MKLVRDCLVLSLGTDALNVDLDDDDEKREESDVFYPEVEYFEIGRVIDNLKLPEKTTKGSRM